MNDQASTAKLVAAALGFMLAVFIGLVFWLWNQQQDPPTPNPTFSIGTCGVPEEDQVPVWTMTGCLGFGWTDVETLTSASLGVDYNGTPYISVVTLLDFLGPLTVATTTLEAHIGFDVDLATGTDDSTIVGGPDGTFDEEPLCDDSAGSLYYDQGGTPGSRFSCSNDITGNSATATRFESAPTTCTGIEVATGIDDQGNSSCVEISTAMLPTITLGTDTSGNYVAEITVGTGLDDDCAAAAGASCTVHLSFATEPDDGDCVLWTTATAQLYGDTCSGGAGGDPDQDLWYTIVPTAGDNLEPDGTTDTLTLLSPDGSVIITGSGTADQLSFSFGTVSIDQLSDVTITSASNAQVLVYSSATSDWANVTLSGDLTISAAGVVTVSNADTADAATADGANCPAGEAAGGVDTAWASQDCIDPITETELDSMSELEAQVGGVNIHTASETIDITDHTNFTCGNYSTASDTADGCDVDRDLARRTLTITILNATDTDDGAGGEIPSAFTIDNDGGIHCEVSTGTASISVDKRDAGAIWSTGSEILGTSLCSSTGDDYGPGALTSATVGADQTVALVIVAMSESADIHLSIRGLIDD